ncbi:MAG: 4-hydroxythreonine-4-phosphate dehydrogenase 1 [candidate division TA06 bacterium ADurb.Bin417]|uniref:4-hydroxythreonine-4-phosphate dehydrogenase 1 n=1 Tax=candidate division TA06 bacterium ADurb.Bin417 TaxID=1852828 RepID=A0A1V5MAQ2_UNCT6|nr:MAG: 4-hydroxythreonine-4-phosphate dehydrogenase 1 [candidate division TA06 bacterium ADurb.Bin417]
MKLVEPGRFRPADFQPGSPSKATGIAALSYLEKAIDLARAGRIRCLVTAPVSKSTISRPGRDFSGHTEFLARAYGISNYGMLFVGGRTRLLLLTTHLPLARVSGLINRDLVIQKIRLARGFILDHWGGPEPVIVCCGINPHAGEAGTLGKEEKEVLEPALDRLRREGLKIIGPVAADTAWQVYRANRAGLLVSAYHDQILPLFKARYFHSGVNVTIGLPLIRTSPDHGTAFNLAHRNLASSASMQAAIRLALKLACRA